MFEVVQDFEKQIASFFGAPYAIAIDSCTHGIELALRYTKATKISVPKRTYLSVPFLANKLNIELEWRDENWVNYYYVTDNIIDAAVLWKKGSYIPNTMMGISFQYQKHLSLGRGGVLLLDNEEAAVEIKKMSYDGRLPMIPWREQNVSTYGYHYYMTPETALLGLEKFSLVKDLEPKIWSYQNYPYLPDMRVFQK